jgi:L-alanine-DL-glutamate epimerase-like enolase superfamily enzyme
VGVGELTRNPRIDVDASAAIEDARLPALAGLALADLPRLLAEWRCAGKAAQGLAFGVELAMLDMMGRRLGMPVSSLLGGAAAADAPDYLSLSCAAPETMAEAARAGGAAVGVIQAKLGTGDPDADLARVRAVLAAMRPDQRLLADFNGALSVEDALRALPAIADPRLMWEEPCDGYDACAEVARTLAAPVVLDQCLIDLATYMRAIREGAAAAMVIKSDAIGGLSVGRIVRDAAGAAGIALRIDGFWAGPVAAAGALHLAVGAPPAVLMGAIDLTAALEGLRPHVARAAPGRVAPAPGPGLGLSSFADAIAWRPLA